MARPNFLQAAMNPQAAQQEIDTHLEALNGVLEQNDAVATLDWVADFALMTSRVSKTEGLNFHFDDVVAVLEQNGYGENVQGVSQQDNAKALISNTMGRMKDGLVPTGYERIFADKLMNEEQPLQSSADIA